MTRDIKPADLYRLLDSSFDHNLVLSGDEEILHISERLAAVSQIEHNKFVGRKISEILEEEHLTELREALAGSLKYKVNHVAFIKLNPQRPVVLLKSVYSDAEGEGLHVLVGNQLPILDGIAAGDEWEMVERVKELSALYAVSEWVEVSSSVQEFFERFPEYIRDGMHYPEHTVVYSEYAGEQFGELPLGNMIKSDLVVDRIVQGHIVIGYHEADLEVLPEEQTMLDRISRTIGLAIDRKDLSETLVAKREELEEQQRQLEMVNSYLDRSNRSFEESKTRLETMFQAIPDEVAIIDANHNVLMTNRHHHKPGEKCHITFFERDRPCIECKIQKIFKSKAPVTLQIECQNKHYEVHALPIFDKNQKVEGIVEFYRDVTHMKAYEQQLQQADKLASLGQLVSGIGHEINNPNQFIRGNIKIIQQAFDDILPIMDEYSQEHPDFKVARLKYDFFRSHIMTLVNDMANGSERIKRIVEDLKRFARKDEGLLDDTIDINTVIDESVRLVHNQVHKFADIELELDVDLPHITGNVQKIEQVLINLIINASQAMSEDKRGMIRVQTFVLGEWVMIKVVDNGKGMSEGTLASIFDPFFTTKRARGGTGLGLSIVYRIVEEHDGNIAAASELGEGTTFTIKLPLPQKALPPTVPEG